MKARRAIWMFFSAALVIGGSVFSVASGLWRIAVSDARAWAAIERSGAFDAYMVEATSHFGSPGLAAGTYRDWAIDQWKSQRTFRHSKQRFLTHGIIFDMARHDGQWTLESIISKEGKTFKTAHARRNRAEQVGDAKRD